MSWRSASPSTQVATAEDDELLSAEGATFGYGSIPVVTDLNINVRRGEIVALLGANGAGKTTSLLGLAGELRPLGGVTRWKRQPTTGPTSSRCAAGLGFVTEERSTIASLSVRDNLRLGRGDLNIALDLFPELRPLLPRKASLLSGGEQQMLSIGRALSRSPALLMVDELSLGLAPMAVDRLLATLQRVVSETSMAVLLVEQHIHRALQLADRAYVLARGRVALEALASDLLANPAEVERLYLSQTATQDRDNHYQTR